MFICLTENVCFRPWRDFVGQEHGQAWTSLLRIYLEVQFRTQPLFLTRRLHFKKKTTQPLRAFSFTALHCLVVIEAMVSVSPVIKWKMHPFYKRVFRPGVHWAVHRDLHNLTNDKSVVVDNIGEPAKLPFATFNEMALYHNRCLREVLGN